MEISERSLSQADQAFRVVEQARIASADNVIPMANRKKA